jgi:predicted enzyme related to lactoylglutathione lyase
METPFNYVAIPCSDFTRALKFYDAIAGQWLKTNPFVPFPMAYFVNKKGENVGHLFQFPGFKPGQEGPLVYLNLADDLNTILEKIIPAGGQILMPKTIIAPGLGYWALFIDSEGNKLALHSKN